MSLLQEEKFLLTTGFKPQDVQIVGGLIFHPSLSVITRAEGAE